MPRRSWLGWMSVLAALLLAGCWPLAQPTASPAGAAALATEVARQVSRARTATARVVFPGPTQAPSQPALTGTPTAPASPTARPPRPITATSPASPTVLASPPPGTAASPTATARPPTATRWPTFTPPRPPATTATPLPSPTTTAPAPDPTATPSAPPSTATPSPPPPPTASATPTPAPQPTATTVPSPTATASPATTATPTACAPTADPGLESQVVALINQERQNAGLPPVNPHSALQAAARDHTQDMICHDFFSHTGSDGSQPWDRASRYGYAWTWIGETLFMGTGISPGTVVNGWMNSPGHRAIVLAPEAVDVGVGYMYDAAEGAWYVTALFGRP